MKHGYIAISSLLVIAVVTLAIGLSVTLLGVNEADSSLSVTKSIEANTIAQSCIEEAFLRLRDNASYTGGSLTVGNGSCTITVAGSGINRTITTVGTLVGPPSYVKRIQAIAKRSGNTINLVSWQEQ